MKSNIVSFLPFIIPLSVFFSTITYADESNTQDDIFSFSVEDLLEYEINTASLRTQSAVQAPAKVTVINSTLIKDRNYRYLSDVLKDLPSVRLSLYSASPDSGSSEMIVRGIRGNNKIVLMWNGQRLNHPDSQPLHITPYLYPLNDVEQIEVIYGSASALYGSDTVSMTINMISTQTNESAIWQAGIDYGRYNEKKAYIQYLGKLGKLKTSFLLDKYQTDGIDFSNFEQFYSRYPDGPGINAGFTFFPKDERSHLYHPTEESTTAKLRFELGNWSMQTYYQRFKTHTQLGWSPLTYEANNKAGNYIFKQLGFFLNHKYEFSDGVFLESLVDHTRNQLDPNSHWSRPNMAPFRIYSDNLEPRGVGTRTYKLNFGNRTKIEERVSWSAINNKLHSVLGISLTTNDLLPKSANLDTPGSYNNSFSTEIDDVQKFHNLSENNMGFFYQGQYEFSDTLSFTLGGRFDEHNRYGSTFNPRFVTNYYDENTNWFAKGIISTSYLAPAPFFTFNTFIIPRDSQQVPNPNLKPEETTNYEFNFGKSFKNYSFETSFFHTKINNLIMQGQVKSIEHLTDELGDYIFVTQHTINSGETIIDGINLEVKNKFNDALSFYASISYIDGETTDTTNNGSTYDLIHNPKVQAKLGLDSKWLNDDLTLYVKIQYTGKAKFHPNNYRFPATDNNGKQFEMNKFWLLNLGGNYKVNKHLKIHFNVDNLLDKKYDQPIVGQETSSWTRVASTPGVPRQIYLGFDVTF
ncbi:TonB-dependent receptor [Pseudoalteromonas denitrificans]|uniref:Outer membrane receptor for ferrienterochelin and colicins n=1 Tax=Pseudoalteromonas denitrificans DSM 6059 TaxID=1123010 RepID=A0A1I1F564_9GAMM|nr:TonB-dependent receptor [Pseudoalteromonas denitrificans]SFB92878.1 Outer membrane receptor for ferrienterochelin and colicins [Pseudoalteromonas denitrificans DSM 6059]